MEVYLRAFDALVSEPERDHRQVDAGGSEQHRAGVPERVRRHAFGDQRRALGGCCLGVLGEQPGDGVRAERRSAASGEQRVLGNALALGEPDPQDCLGFLGQGRAPLFPALARHPEMGALGERHVVQAQSDQLRDAQAGLDCCQQQGVVASTEPAGAVRAASSASISSLFS